MILAGWYKLLPCYFYALKSKISVKIWSIENKVVTLRQIKTFLNYG